MPRIPMSDKAGMIRHQRDTVPMSGTVGMNFNLNQGRTIADLGNVIADAGNKIGHSGMQIVSARNQFLAQEQETQNKLAATQARNLYRKINSDLEIRMAENPAEFSHFREWAVQADKQYSEDAKEFTDKMSEDFRKQFDTEMEGLRVESMKQRSLLGIHAKVTSDYNLFQAQFKDFALRGDLAECNRLLEEHRGNLISEQEYQQKKLDYNRLADFGEVKRLIEAGTPDIASRLKERDSSGNYTNFKHLESSARDRFMRVAEANDAQKRADENQSLLDRLNNGEQLTIADIDRAFEGKNSPEAVRQKNQQRSILRQFQKAQETARKQEARERQQEIEQEKRDAVNAHAYRILSHEFPADPARRQVEYATMRNEIFTRYAGDGATVKRLLSQLDETLKAKEKPDSSYKNTFSYQYGRRLLDNMEGLFFSRHPGRGESWYSFATNVYNDDSNLKATNFELAKLHFDEFMKANPQAKMSDIEAFLEKMRQDVNQAECDKLMEFWQNYRVDTSKVSGEGEKELLMNNGRIAVFGSDRIFKRWKED